MKERPILFSAPMVRALLDGSKTQTRRIVKPQPIEKKHFVGGHSIPIPKRALMRNETGGEVAVAADYVHICCPYGQPGDRLWVRETWQGPLFDDMDACRAEPADFQKPEFCEYAADGGPAPEFMTMDDELVCRWRPSIHMPRWASRITLEITGVRVEKLQDISNADCKAEGVLPDHSDVFPHARAYQTLWEQINGAGSWEANPWVWVVEFKRIEQQILAHAA
jgi:hypothetical protein